MKPEQKYDAISRLVKTAGYCCMLLMATCYLSSCKKLTGCITTTGYNEYYVELPVKLYPAKDTFKIGDTIFMEQSFKDELYDYHNHRTMKFDNFDFRNVMILSNLLDYKDYSIKHEYYTLKGQTELTSYNDYQIKYDYNNGVYTHKVVFVLKKAGLFDISFLSFRGGGDKVDFTNCKTENLFISFSMNNKVDNNFYMRAESDYPPTAVTTKEEFDKFGGYCFYVK